MEEQGHCGDHDCDLCNDAYGELEEELVWCGCGREKVYPMDNGRGYCGGNQWCMP